DLWYRRSGGDCTIWIHEHTLIVKPKDAVGIFSDMTCDKRFCGGDITYDTLWKIDVNRDCSARILPDCSLSDM
ncbi:MAG TPA: hypothetical protein VK435_00870, partial [Thermodesulfovibrionales bacterium]|nr:hypothetical protein [Thermodesulfovibrionales bacterium]